MYGNFLIVAPDNQVLCRTNQRKINWYVSKGLADRVNENTIRLRFEPSGRKGAGHPFIIAEKDNKCVCCGSLESITRHHVVPYCFRKFFPKDKKDHCFHDVVPLCSVCHNKYEVYATELKEVIIEEFGVPRNKPDNKIFNVRLAGHALSLYADKIPNPRKKDLINTLEEYYKKTGITQEDIVKAKDIYIPKQESFGKYVVEHLKDIQAFVVRWRKHFVEQMKPKYMPKHWSIDHEL